MIYEKERQLPAYPPTGQVESLSRREQYLSNTSC